LRERRTLCKLHQVRFEKDTESRVGEKREGIGSIERDEERLNGCREVCGREVGREDRRAEGKVNRGNRRKGLPDGGAARGFAPPE